MAWYDIAEMLGGRTVEEWKRCMSIDEFHGWIARSEIKRENKQ